MVFRFSEYNSITYDYLVTKINIFMNKKNCIYLLQDLWQDGHTLPQNTASLTVLNPFSSGAPNTIGKSTPEKITWTTWSTWQSGILVGHKMAVICPTVIRPESNVQKRRRQRGQHRLKTPACICTWQQHLFGSMFWFSTVCSKEPDS